tara:strand:+ start:92 stop:637 length:546 start_codon:yes stop_codon:yes gene_type:complete
MHKPHFFIITLLLSVFLLNSCDKDNVSNTSSSPTNYFSYDGRNYNLDIGYIEDYGDNENGSYNFGVTLVPEGIEWDFNEDELTGTGDGSIYLDLNTSSEDGLVSGKYNFSSDRETFTLVYGAIAIGLELGLGAEEIEIVDKVVAGEVDVSFSGSNTILEFDLTTSTNKKAKGRFNKRLTFL